MAKTIIGRNLPLYKGEYSSATIYDRFDVVLYDGSSYVSKLPNNQNKPVTNTTYWQLLAQRGEFTEQQLEDFKAEVVAESKEEMDSYTDEKKSALDTYEDTKETELNTYTGTKKNELNTYASGLKNDFDTNASTKTTAFNDNATSKTTAFNTNATNKTTDFNDNATAKTTAFDDNASDKTDDFNDNATAKTTAFDGHVEQKTEEFDENVEALQQEIDELSENMPWNTTEQATEITVNDAAKYSRNKLELFGNTEQTQYTGVQLLDMSDAVNGYFTGDPGNTNNSIDGFHTQEYIDVGNSTSIYGRFEALDNIKIGRFYIQEYNENKESIKRHTIGIYDSVFTLGQVRKWNINLSEDTKYIRLSGYVLQKLEGGGYISQTPIKDNWNSLVKTTISYTDVDIYEPYTGGQPSPNPDYPQDIHVFKGSNIIHTENKDYPIDIPNNINLCKIGDDRDYYYKQDRNWYKDKKIHTFTMNGSGTYSIVVEYSDYILYSYSPGNAYRKKAGLYNIIANKLPSLGNQKNSILGNSSGYGIQIAISKEYATNVSTLKEWLAENPITVSYPLLTPTTIKITDETFIAQLDEIYEHLQLVKGTNNITVTAEDLAPNMQLSYMQDLPTKLNNLASRIELLEE